MAMKGANKLVRAATQFIDASAKVQKAIELLETAGAKDLAKRASEQAESLERYSDAIFDVMKAGARGDLKAVAGGKK